MSLSSPRTISIIKACASLLLCAALCACDPIFGMSRSALLSTEPDFTCVQRVLEQTPGIAQVKVYPRYTRDLLFESQDSISQSLGFDGTPGSNIGGIVAINRYRGQWSYAGHDTWIRQPPPQAHIDATRPVLKLLEVRLAEQCGLTELKTGIKESCTRVSCTG